MKKNILTILILALTLINVVLSSLVIFVVIPASSKANKLVTDVYSIIDLEKDIKVEEEGKESVSVLDTETSLIEKELTPNLKSLQGDSTVHYASMDSVTLSLNKKADNYKKLKESLESNTSYVTEAVNDVFSSHTLEEANSNREQLKSEIVTKLQEYFASDFIVNISFGNLTFQ